MAEPDLAGQVKAVRGFNRAYTRHIGLLQEHLLESPFSLTEARVLYELAHREDVTARALAEDLGLDAGYLSRMLASFQRRGLVVRKRSGADGRARLLRVSGEGPGRLRPARPSVRATRWARSCGGSPRPTGSSSSTRWLASGACWAWRAEAGASPASSFGSALPSPATWAG